MRKKALLIGLLLLLTIGAGIVVHQSLPERFTPHAPPGERSLIRDGVGVADGGERTEAEKAQTKAVPFPAPVT